MFQAGSDTMATSILWFFMAMLLYPEVLRKAQEEIDGVVGSDGTVLPCLEHMKELPYCVAILKETFRWMPAVPGCFPHCPVVDDTFKGYKISAKTMVIPNIWAMHRDEEQFDKPSEFLPERYLREVASSSPTLLDPAEGHYGFGFGRRICPGKSLASRTVWIAITRIMWACNVNSAKTPDGQEISVDPNRSTSQIISRPLPFPLVITPRSQVHHNTIRAEWSRLKNVPAFGSPATVG